MIFTEAFTSTLLWRILSSGAVFNFFVVIVGSLFGLFLRRGFPEKVRTALIGAMAFCVLYIGVTGIFESNINVLIIIISIAVGTIIGEFLNLDKQINKMAAKFEKALSRDNSRFAEGFVTATMLFCVGAMTVVGSIESGINGDNSTLYSKSIIDCISAAALSSSLGAGVMLSAVSVLVIEGGITLLAAVISPILTDSSIAHMSVIGSLLIITLSLNMLGITKIKIMNYMPCILLPLIFCMFI